MKISALFKDLDFVGQIEGDRRTYYVFKGMDYLLISANGRDGFNVNVVDREVPEVITKKFAGQRVTGRMLADRARRPDLFSPGFSSLNALYVTGALGLAKKLVKRDGRAMVFKIKGR
jgi:hypothetical protein